MRRATRMPDPVRPSGRRVRTDELGVANLAPDSNRWYRFLASRAIFIFIFIFAPALSGYFPCHRKTHRGPCSDSRPGREPCLGRSRTRSGPACDFRTCGQTFSADAIAATGRPISRSTRRPTRHRHPGKSCARTICPRPCTTIGSRARANVEYRAQYAGLDQGGIAGPRRCQFSDRRPRRFAASSHAGRRERPLRINRFAGRLLLRDGKFRIEQGKLQTPGSIYQFSGTASMTRDLDIKLMRDGTHGFNITGTLTSLTCHQHDSRDSGRSQTMKACSALLLAVFPGVCSL